MPFGAHTQRSTKCMQKPRHCADHVAAASPGRAAGELHRTGPRAAARGGACNGGASDAEAALAPDLRPRVPLVGVILGVQGLQLDHGGVPLEVVLGLGVVLLRQVDVAVADRLLHLLHGLGVLPDQAHLRQIVIDVAGVVPESAREEVGSCLKIIPPRDPLLLGLAIGERALLNVLAALDLDERVGEELGDDRIRKLAGHDRLLHG
mmetsp:Transcript_12593/g.37428  ORF Transcript_12593/g.37428 Transcript_12593/m.37428 type:complete len:206 (-) Transcript_12593:83-700(-)